MPFSLWVCGVTCSLVLRTRWAPVNHILVNSNYPNRTHTTLTGSWFLRSDINSLILVGKSSMNTDGSSAINTWAYRWTKHTVYLSTQLSWVNICSSLIANRNEYLWLNLSLCGKIVALCIQTSSKLYIILWEVRITHIYYTYFSSHNVFLRVWRCPCRRVLWTTAPLSDTLVEASPTHYTTQHIHHCS